MEEGVGKRGPLRIEWGNDLDEGGGCRKRIGVVANTEKGELGQRRMVWVSCGLFCEYSCPR